MARVIYPAFRHVGVTGEYGDGGEQTHRVVSAETHMRGKGTLTVGGASPVEGPSLIAKLVSEPAFAEALALLGSHDLGWEELYKIYEVLLDAG